MDTITGWRGVPEKFREELFRFEEHLSSYHGIDLDEYDSLLVAQDNKCGICGKQHAYYPRKLRLVVDHCHATKTIRGLLCSRCNVGLGQLGDSLDGVLAAAEYLAASNTKAFKPTGRRKVYLVRRGNRYYCRWIDPISNRRMEKTAKTGDVGAAELVRREYENQLNEHIERVAHVLQPL